MVNMADVHSKAARSYNMSRICSKDTKPEKIVRKYLFNLGFRYRKNDKRLPGTPDIVLTKYKVCIFVNGCFWHKHEGCRYFVWPKNNADTWRKKIEANVARDHKKYQQLKDIGWKVLIVWECELKPQTRDETLSLLASSIKVKE